MACRYKKILVTGATGTIGTAVARNLALPGTKLTLCYRSDEDKAARLRENLADICDVNIARFDLALPGSPQSLVDRCDDLMGGLDLLIHCAATFEKTPFGTVTEDQWQRIIDVNLTASFFLAQAAGARMETDGGSIVMFSDVAAIKPYGGYLPYCIAKAGVEALVRGLAKSLAPKVTINAIAPYVVSKPSGITDKGFKDMLDKMPMRRPQTAEEIAELVKSIACSTETMTGQVVAVDGGRLLR